MLFHAFYFEFSVIFTNAIMLSPHVESFTRKFSALFLESAGFFLTFLNIIKKYKKIIRLIC